MSREQVQSCTKHQTEKENAMKTKTNVKAGTYNISTCVTS
jgi:hypothetical protein